jgi:hypothetical protein
MYSCSLHIASLLVIVCTQLLQTMLVLFGFCTISLRAPIASYGWNLELNFSSDHSYVQLSYAIRTASYGPGYFFSRGQRQGTTACSTWQLFIRGASLIFNWLKFLECAKELYVILLYSLESSGAKSVGLVHEFENSWSYMENLQVPILILASEQEALRNGFQFQRFYSFKSYLLADKWRSRFLVLRRAHAVSCFCFACSIMACESYSYSLTIFTCKGMLWIWCLALI